MKKYLLTSLVVTALLSAANASAQDRELDSEGKANYMYLEQDDILTDELGQGIIEVWLENETNDLNSFMMDIYLPEGFTIPKDDWDEFYVEPNNGPNNKTRSHLITVGVNDGFYRLVGLSMSGTAIRTGKDILLKIHIQAPEGYVKGSSMTRADDGLNGKITNIEIASKSNTVNPHYFPDITFEVDKDVSTGIGDVEFDNLNGLYPEGIFDLQGRPINVDGELSPGIYIINGKKVVVK